MKTVHYLLLICIVLCFAAASSKPDGEAWIRINQLGYLPQGVKVAVWCSKENAAINNFQLIDVKTGKAAFSATAGKAFGAYGPFTQTYRLNFSTFNKPGKNY